MLNLIDEFTHECLAIRVDRKLNSVAVIDVLSDQSLGADQLCQLRPEGQRSTLRGSATAFAVDRPVEQTGRLDAVVAQAGAESRGLPLAVGHFIDEREIPTIEFHAARMAPSGTTPAVTAKEVFYRTFDNRRQIAAYLGLAPTPFQSGGMDRDRRINRAGNSRARNTMVQLAWLWLRYQPESGRARWFRERVGELQGRTRRIAIIAW
jgi:hypothetical protein